MSEHTTPAWEARRQQLAGNYTTDGSDGYSEHCEFVAAEFAELLKASGETPYVVWLTGAKIGESETATLIPKPYEGRVRWGAHCICITKDGIVYDPILESPEPWETYPETAFGADVIVDRVKLYDE